MPPSVSERSTGITTGRKQALTEPGRPFYVRQCHGGLFYISAAWHSLDCARLGHACIFHITKGNQTEKELENEMETAPV